MDLCTFPQAFLDTASLEPPVSLARGVPEEGRALRVGRPGPWHHRQPGAHSYSVMKQQPLCSPSTDVRAEGAGRMGMQGSERPPWQQPWTSSRPRGGREEGQEALGPEVAHVGGSAGWLGRGAFLCLGRVCWGQCREHPWARCSG